MRFLYTPSESAEGVSRPLVTLTMCGPDDRINVDAIIDSGADHNWFSVAFGEKCGIDIASGVKVEAGKYHDTGEPILGRLVTVHYTLRNYEWDGDTVFVDNPKPYGLLGQKGFFDAFDVKFSLNKNMFFIDPTRAEIIDQLSGNEG